MFCADFPFAFDDQPIPLEEVGGARHVRGDHLISAAYAVDLLRIPIWVAYELTKSDAKKHLVRLDCFRKDPRLDDEVASVCSDYDEPIFDRGHMIPNADLARGRFAMTNSFIAWVRGLSLWQAFRP